MVKYTWPKICHFNHCNCSAALSTLTLLCTLCYFLNFFLPSVIFLAQWVTLCLPRISPCSQDGLSEPSWNPTAPGALWGLCRACRAWPSHLRSHIIKFPFWQVHSMPWVTLQTYCFLFSCQWVSSLFLWPCISTSPALGSSLLLPPWGCNTCVGSSPGWTLSFLPFIVTCCSPQTDCRSQRWAVNFLPADSLRLRTVPCMPNGWSHIWIMNLKG